MVIKSAEDAKDTSNATPPAQAIQDPSAPTYWQGFQMPEYVRGGPGFRGRGRHGHGPFGHGHHRPEVVSLEGDQGHEHHHSHHPHSHDWTPPSPPDPPLPPMPPVPPTGARAHQRPPSPPFGIFDPLGIASFIEDVASAFVEPGRTPPGSSDSQHRRGPMGHPGGPRGRRGGPMGWGMRGRGGWGGPWGSWPHGHPHPPPGPHGPAPPAPPPEPGHAPGFPHPHHGHGCGPIRPSMNIQQTGNTYTITVELPGLQKEQVDISVAEGVLTISGEFVDTTAPSAPPTFPTPYEEADGFDMMDESGTLYDETTELEGGVQAMNLNTSTPSGHDGFVLRERRFGPFKRSVRLPTWVNVDTIKATMAHGVLSLVIEKPQEGDKPAKKISVF